MRLKGNNYGDTIIEVLLALAVLGVIIGGGYSIATRSLTGVQISQERNEATKVAEGQLESLKAYISGKDVIALLGNTSPSPIINAGDLSEDVPFGPNGEPDWPLGGVNNRIGFCFDDTNGDIVRFQTIPEGNKDDIASYPVECTFGLDDGFGRGRYNVYIETDFKFLSAVPGGFRLSFTNYVHVTWERPGGRGFEHLYLNDRFVWGQ